MCIGIPMKIIKSGHSTALCEGMGTQRKVDTFLVGDQPVGTWVLVFLNSAREVLTEKDAKRISDAITALSLVMEGAGSSTQNQEAIDALFPDLVGREPPRPM